MLSNKSWKGSALSSNLEVTEVELVALWMQSDGWIGGWQWEKVLSGKLMTLPLNPTLCSVFCAFEKQEPMDHNNSGRAHLSGWWRIKSWESKWSFWTKWAQYVAAYFSMDILDGQTNSSLFAHIQSLVWSSLVLALSIDHTPLVCSVSASAGFNEGILRVMLAWDAKAGGHLNLSEVSIHLYFFFKKKDQKNTIITGAS